MENPEYSSTRATRRRKIKHDAPKRQSFQKLKNKTAKDWLAMLPKTYLVLALFFGTLFSVAMPVFNEPDAGWHYAFASNMAGKTTDLSKYIGKDITAGSEFNGLKPNIQSGNYFQVYYLNNVKLMPLEKQNIRYNTSTIPSLKSYFFWAHLIPAAGVWLGYQVYPSIGVMITFGRLLNMLVLVLVNYFILRKLRRGRLLFTAILLSPVALNLIASLSYDGLSFSLVALVVMLAINCIDRGWVRKKDLIYFLLSAVIFYFGAKLNLLLVLLLYPLLLMGLPLFRQKRRALWEMIPSLGKKIAGVLAALALLGVLTFGQLTNGFSFSFLIRLIQNLIFNFRPNTTFENVNTLFTQGNQAVNLVPFWLTGLWFILIALVCLVEEKFLSSRLLSYGSLTIFILGIVGLNFGLRNYVDAGLPLANRLAGAISGVQGRYFLPTLLLLSIFAGNRHFKTRIKVQKNVIFFMLIVIIFSATVLIFDAWFGLINL